MGQLDYTRLTARCGSGTTWARPRNCLGFPRPIDAAFDACGAMMAVCEIFCGAGAVRPVKEPTRPSVGSWWNRYGVSSVDVIRAVKGETPGDGVMAAIR